MANQNSPLNGQGDNLDLMVNAANAARLKAAGDPVAEAGALGSSTGSSSQLVQIHKSTTGDTVAVASSATSGELLAANPLRKGVAIENASTQILYIRLGSSAASSGTHLIALAPDAYYEVPFNPTCAIQGKWVSANGFAMVTEFV